MNICGGSDTCCGRPWGAEGGCELLSRLLLVGAGKGSWRVRVSMFGAVSCASSGLRHQDWWAFMRGVGGVMSSFWGSGRDGR